MAVTRPGTLTLRDVHPGILGLVGDYEDGSELDMQASLGSGRGWVSDADRTIDDRVDAAALAAVATSAQILRDLDEPTCLFLGIEVTRRCSWHITLCIAPFVVAAIIVTCVKTLSTR